jgi:hypothetical protein
MNHRIGDRRFLFAWQAIRAATQPAPEATTWRVAGVRWSRHRLSQAGPEHSFSVEVHRLDHEDPHHRWGVMVVTEHWWDERHNPLRNHVWATHLLGSKERIMAWFEAQAQSIEKSHTVAG